MDPNTPLLSEHILIDSKISPIETQAVHVKAESLLSEEQNIESPQIRALLATADSLISQDNISSHFLHAIIERWKPLREKAARKLLTIDFFDTNDALVIIEHVEACREEAWLKYQSLCTAETNSISPEALQTPYGEKIAQFFLSKENVSEYALSCIILNLPSLRREAWERLQSEKPGPTARSLFLLMYDEPHLLQDAPELLNEILEEYLVRGERTYSWEGDFYRDLDFLMRKIPTMKERIAEFLINKQPVNKLHEPSNLLSIVQYAEDHRKRAAELLFKTPGCNEYHLSEIISYEPSMQDVVWEKFMECAHPKDLLRVMDKVDVEKRVALERKLIRMVLGGSIGSEKGHWILQCLEDVKNSRFY